MVVVSFDCKWLRHVPDAANPWPQPSVQGEGHSAGGDAHQWLSGCEPCGTRLSLVLGMGKEWGWQWKPQQCLCPCAVHCQPCWRREERQSELLRMEGGGSGSVCQPEKLCIPRVLPGCPWWGV